MAPPPLLALRDAGIRVAERQIFAGVDMALGLGDRVCLVGRNGTGKSTLLKALAGEIDLDSGSVFRQPGVRVAYAPQEPAFDPSLNAGAFVALGLPPEDAAQDHRVAAALGEVAIAADRPLAALSGGEGRRISLARALVGEPDILLLDEPTNHLDIAAIEWLEARLAAHRAGLLLISHDRAFLTRLSRRTLWLDRGTLREHDQGYAAFEDWSETILAAESAADARLDKLIARETAWSREGISARRKRNQGRLRRLQGLRRERAERIDLRTAVMTAARAETGGRLVFELDSVSKAFPGAAGPKVIVRNFSTRILRGDRVGLIGRNGAGKSTLVGLLTGAIEPDGGTVRRGTNLLPAVFEQAIVGQRGATLDPDRTLWDTLTDGGGEVITVQQARRHVASYLKDFLFDERQFRAKVSTLSGGERNRLMLARILAQPSNVLILDEPTNDLDLETLDLLERVLSDYDGTLLLVTHDRDFLDRVVTSTIAVEGDGVVHEYVGGYSDYLRQRRQPAPARVAARPAAKEPSRLPETPRPRTAARLSFKEQRELDTLPAEIDRLAAEKARIEADLADPDLMAGGRAALESATRRHGELAAALAAAEERWLVLAERAEGLGRRKAE
ncbi:MAG: ATP-binding cassette domain-containing protein [Alphaproteobacteria bacterium]|nr:ATP-binding cassette domain-containing protein [Alphaproteobacteria bacterium]